MPRAASLWIFGAVLLATPALGAPFTCTAMGGRYVYNVSGVVGESEETEPSSAGNSQEFVLSDLWIEVKEFGKPAFFMDELTESAPFEYIAPKSTSGLKLFVDPTTHQATILHLDAGEAAGVHKYPCVNND